MNIEFLDGWVMPVILAACWCVGYVLKLHLPYDTKWIPTVLFVIGAVSGFFLLGGNYEAVVKGMISGLAAVGTHQLFYQHMKLHMDEDEVETMGAGDGLDFDDEEEVEENIFPEDEEEAEVEGDE